MKQEFETFYESFKTEVNNQSKTICGSYGFNILEAQCGHVVENSHTNILMSLLEYKNQYGFVFLEDFIRWMKFTGISIDSSDDVRFETEHYGILDGKKGRIDGLIYVKKEFAIILENKVNGAGNQDEQLARYIESVAKDLEIDVDKGQVYVVFLTKDGVEIPDEASVEFMKKAGIIDGEAKQNDGKNEVALSGPRYYASSYRNDILPWLENNIQPMVMQKEQILNAGLVQYIDYLKGMLNVREEKTALQSIYKIVFDDLVCGKAFENDIGKENKWLHEFYIELSTKRREIKGTGDDEELSVIEVLLNTIYEKAEEPMAEFMQEVKSSFTSGDQPLIKEKDYIVRHHFTYYYIVVRDKSWPKNIEIGWYPFCLGTKCGKLYYKFSSDLGIEGFCYNEKAKIWQTKEKPYTSLCGHDGLGVFKSIIEAINKNKASWAF